MGRNYDGNWNGASGPNVKNSLKEVFINANGNNDRIGYQIYVQEADGTISKRQLPHVADQYIPHRLSDARRRSLAKDEAPLYKSFLNSMYQNKTFFSSQELFSYFNRGNR